MEEELSGVVDKILFRADNGWGVVSLRQSGGPWTRLTARQRRALAAGWRSLGPHSQALALLLGAGLGERRALRTGTVRGDGSAPPGLLIRMPPRSPGTV